MKAGAVQRRIASIASSAWCRGQVFFWQHSKDVLLIAGTALLFVRLTGTSLAFELDLPVDIDPPGGGAPTNVTVDTSAIDEATCWLYYFQEGPYGALLLAVTGIGALVSCAVGAYRACLNLLAVALGSWLIRPVATILFDYSITNCNTLMNVPATPAGGG